MKTIHISSKDALKTNKNHYKIRKLKIFIFQNIFHIIFQFFSNV